MKILVDENLPRAIAVRLLSSGHEVEFARDIGWGRSDPDILAHAKSRQLILTEDKDFGELVFRSLMPTQGVLLLRLEGLSNRHRCEIVDTTIATHGEALLGCFSVLSAGRLRTQSRRDEST